MKAIHHQGDIAGIALLHALVYVGVLTVILGTGGTALFRLWSVSGAMRRQGDDLRNALSIGERWRADVRATDGAIHVESEAGVQVLHLPRTNGMVQWGFHQATVWRRNDTNAEWVVQLPRVRASVMAPEPRGELTAWRWELELEPASKKARLRPVLDFYGVPGRPAL